MKAETLNLDDLTEVEDFLEEYNSLKGIALANRLGITGKGRKALATALSNYAWNKSTASLCRVTGKIDRALMYEGICDRIYKDSILGSVADW